MPSLSHAMTQLQYQPSTKTFYQYFKKYLKEGLDDRRLHAKLKQLITSPDFLKSTKDEHISEVLAAFANLMNIYHNKQGNMCHGFLSLLNLLPKAHRAVRPHIARFIAHHPSLKHLCKAMVSSKEVSAHKNHRHLLTLLKTAKQDLPTAVQKHVLRTLAKLYSRKSNLYTSRIQQAFIRAYANAHV